MPSFVTSETCNEISEEEQLIKTVESTLHLFTVNTNTSKGIFQQMM